MVDLAGSGGLLEVPLGSPDGQPGQPAVPSQRLPARCKPRQLNPKLSCPPPPWCQFEGARNIPAFGGTPVLDYYDLDHVSKWGWVGWAWLFFLAFLTAAGATLAAVRHQRR